MDKTQVYINSERINKLWHIHTIEYYSTIKKNYDKHNNVGESQKHNEWEKSRYKREHTSWFHLYEILEKANYSDGKQMNDCLESGVEGDQEQKGTRNILQVRELLNTLFKVMLTQFYLLNKSHWTVLWKQFFFFSENKILLYVTISIINKKRIK